MEPANRQNFIQNFISNIFGAGSPNYGQSIAPNIDEQAIQNQNTFSGLQGQVSSMRGGDASRELSPLFPYGAIDPRDPGRPQTITSRPVIDPRSVFGESFSTPLPPNPIGPGPVRPGIRGGRPRAFPFPNDTPNFPRQIDPGIGDGTPRPIGLPIMPKPDFPNDIPNFPRQIDPGIGDGRGRGFGLDRGVNNPIDPQIDGGPARRDSNGNIVTNNHDVIDPRTGQPVPLPPIHVPTIEEFLGIGDEESRQKFNQAEHDKPPEQRMTVDQIMQNYRRVRDKAIGMQKRMRDMIQNLLNNRFNLQTGQGNTSQNLQNPLQNLVQGPVRNSNDVGSTLSENININLANRREEM